MKENYIAKINKLGKVGHSFAKICTVLLDIALVSCIVATVLLALVPAQGVTVTTSHNAQIDMDMSNTIIPNLVGFDADSGDIFELDGIRYDQFSVTGNLATQTAVARSTPYTYSLHDMLWVTLTGGGVCLAMLYLFRKITGLFVQFRDCETPFTTEIADSIRQLSIAFIPVIIGTWVVEAVTKVVTTGVWDIVIGIDMTMVIIVVVVLMMSEIFRYGAMLQTESDETL